MLPSTAQHPSQITAYLHRQAYQQDLKREPQCQSIIQAKGQKSKCILKSQLIQSTTQTYSLIGKVTRTMWMV